MADHHDEHEKDSASDYGEASPKEQRKAFEKSFKAMRRQNKTDVAAQLAKAVDRDATP